MGGSVTKLQHLTNRLAARASAYGLEVSTENSKVMVNSKNTTSATTNISMNGEPLEEVSRSKYMGATLSKDDNCTAEICIRIPATTAAMAWLNMVWKSNISFQTKLKLFRSPVVSILLYGCETWTQLADDERKTQAFENKCLRKLIRIP
ncbi:uncharacterized protein [Littorina saxatilis]|uniref:uncharacterized protein n=1 Tax=Littorina saxatilis TaxID=31220 RepID=UPI0038B4F1AA